jgi:drug/metabolite transporter (DMT)-like permease
MHAVRARWQLGFALALLTAVLWGLVPLAMTPLLVRLDPVTVSWYRYAGAGAALCVLFAARGGLRLPRGGGAPGLALFALAVVTLTGNTVLYVYSMHYIPAPVAQIVVQLAPVLLMLGSLLVFGERFGALQWAGFAVLVTGIVAFCAERLRLSGTELPGFGLGVTIMVVAATCWAIYGLAQKALLRYGSPQVLLMGLYLSGALLMTPAASPGDARALAGTELALLVFLALNTLFAYGAFASALECWESSKVSAVLALQPLVTLFGASLLGRLWPEAFPPQPLTAAVLGASLLVVGGSMSCALGARRGPRPAA